MLLLNMSLYNQRNVTFAQVWGYNFLKQGFPGFFICYRAVSETMYCKVMFTEMVANLSHWTFHASLRHMFQVCPICLT